MKVAELACNKGKYNMPQSGSTQEPDSVVGLKTGF